MVPDCVRMRECHLYIRLALQPHIRQVVTVVRTAFFCQVEQLIGEEKISVRTLMAVAQVPAVEGFEAHREDTQVQIGTALHIFCAQGFEKLLIRHIRVHERAIAVPVVFDRVDVVNESLCVKMPDCRNLYIT